MVDERRFDRILNIIAAGMVAQPANKYLFIRGLRTSKIGKMVVISPGTRIYGSTIGDRVNIGIKAHIEDSTVEDDVYITANAVVKNSHIGKGSIVGANALLEDARIPPGVVVGGTGKILGTVEEFRRKKPKRDVEVYFFKKNPMWYWTQVREFEGFLRMPFSVPGWIVLNHIPFLLGSYRMKYSVMLRFTASEGKFTVSPEATADSIFPEKISVRDGARVEKDTVLLTHSFLGYNDFRLETGKCIVGEGTRIGRHSVVVPGVEIPPDQDIPEWSVATSNGYYIVKEDVRVPYGE